MSSTILGGIGGMLLFGLFHISRQLSAVANDLKRIETRLKALQGYSDFS